MATKTIYFRTIGKYKKHKMGTVTTYKSTLGPNGPELLPISIGKIHITESPTPVKDPVQIKRLRSHKLYGRVYVECNAKGDEIKKHADVVNAHEGEAETPDEKTLEETNAVELATTDPDPDPIDEVNQADAADYQKSSAAAEGVTDANSAVAFLAGSVQGFSDNDVKAKNGVLSFAKIKKVAKENGIEFPNYGK